MQIAKTGSSTQANIAWRRAPHVGYHVSRYILFPIQLANLISRIKNSENPNREIDSGSHPCTKNSPEKLIFLMASLEYIILTFGLIPPDVVPSEMVNNWYFSQGTTVSITHLSFFSVDSFKYLMDIG
ncbi:hypothetical protein SK128_020743 [Halocaridina rubra]|uniref:Uncharacterized protein n=1 Tax=Halocaridina rubra TaxID=373956 RepID=A0AAN8WFI0_HALRR